MSKLKVAALCTHVVENPRHYPPRVLDAAVRLSAAFGPRKLASISDRDLDAYLKEAAGNARDGQSWRLDGAAELACYDVYMLGSFARVHGDEMFAVQVERWLAPHVISIMAAQ